MTRRVDQTLIRDLMNNYCPAPKRPLRLIGWSKWTVTAQAAFVTESHAVRKWTRNPFFTLEGKIQTRKCQITPPNAILKLSRETGSFAQASSPRLFGNVRNSQGWCQMEAFFFLWHAMFLSTDKNPTPSDVCFFTSALWHPKCFLPWRFTSRITHTESDKKRNNGEQSGKKPHKKTAPCQFDVGSLKTYV